MGSLVLGLFLAVLAVQYFRVSVTTYTVTHPHSYQARVVTRNASYYFYAVRNGTNLEIRRKPHDISSWSLAGTIATGISANQGDIASIAVDASGTLHVVYYKANGGNYDLEYRSSTDNGTTFSSATVLQSSITWGDASSSSADIHVDTNSHLHVVFSDDAGSKPYYTYHNGTSWSTPNLVANIASNELRPTVITINTGRIFVSFTNASGQCSVYYSDNGTSWTSCSPTTTGAAATSNVKLTGNGNTVYVSAQQTSGTRTMIMNECDGSASPPTFGAWDPVETGTGADMSVFIDSGGFKHVTYRQYNTPNYVVFHSSKASGSWVRTTITEDVSNILPTAYWQEYHRFSPTENRPLVIIPESAGTIYSQYISGVTLG